MYDEGNKSVDVYLALSGVCSQKDSSWCRIRKVVDRISIPNGVEELCEKCFSECGSLSSVTFGLSSSLKVIGKSAFWGTGVH